MPRVMRRQAALLAAAALAAAALSGCASLPGAQVVTAQGREVALAVSRGRGPTLVFENGLGGTMAWWAKVWPEVTPGQAALAYDRPGTGGSAPMPPPMDGTQIVANLRAVLAELRLPPPYVLVGHSLGGLYMQLFARQYPDEVGALVLVDATHPEQLRGAGAPDQWPAWARIALGVLASDATRQEFASIDATGQHVLALPAPPPQVRVWVLSALKPMREHSALADDSNAKRVALAGLYPGARQVWVDCGHAIPLECPQAVVAAIREALAPQP